MSKCNICIYWTPEKGCNHMTPEQPEAKIFPNGFSSWQETHFEIVSAITDARNLTDDKIPVRISRINDTQGTGGFYELAEELTDKFERDCPTHLFNDMDYYETIESFIETEIYNE